MPKANVKSGAAKAAQKRANKPVVARTMQTRAKNANINPQDLEVQSSEAEDAPPPLQKRKRAVKSKDEKAADKQKRLDGIEMVGLLEEEIAEQVIVEASTPRPVPALKKPSRTSSYECPDPPLVAVKPRVSASRVILSSEDEDSEEIRPAKKARHIKDELDRMRAKRVSEKAAELDSVLGSDLEDNEEEMSLLSQSIIDLNIGDADSDFEVKKEKYGVPEMNGSESDSSIEIVHENINLKQKSVVLSGKLRGAKPQTSVSHTVKPNVIAKNDHPVRDHYSKGDDADETPTALVRDWSAKVLPHSWGRVGNASRKKSSAATTPTLTSGTSQPTRASKAVSSNSHTPKHTSVAPRPTSKLSSLANSRTAVNNQVKIKTSYQEIVADSQSDDEGGISERDERKGGKCILAANSPPKPKGQRVTSASLVKIQSSLKVLDTLKVFDPLKVKDAVKAEPRVDGPSNASGAVKSEESDIKLTSRANDKRAVKPCSKATNQDLPVKYLQNDAWLFNVDDTFLIRALRILCEHYFGGTGLVITITIRSPEFILVTQRLADTWRTILASSAIAAINAFFDSLPKVKNSNSRRSKLAEHLYLGYRFLYLSAEGDDPKNYKGLFCGPLVIQVFGAHLNIVHGYPEVLELYANDGITKLSQIPHARGALAICATVVMRALALHATGGVTVESIQDAKDKRKKNILLPAVIPPLSEREKDGNTKRRSIFSAQDWAKPTASFYQKCVSKVTDEKMVTIMASAKQVSKASRQQAREEVAEYDPDDSIAMLGDGSEASSSDRDMQIDTSPQDFFDMQDDSVLGAMAGSDGDDAGGDDDDDMIED
ncbi:hypothetical protein HWV62_3278 [Athelia sp. TMB]|nr:hypothetical protein HWV62_3278 [Athelia sp. TMB]